MSKHYTTCRACGILSKKTFCESCAKDCIASVGVHCPKCERIKKASPGTFGSIKLECGHDLILLTNEVWLCRDASSIISKETFVDHHEPHEPFAVVELPLPTATQTDLWKT